MQVLCRENQNFRSLFDLSRTRHCNKKKCFPCPKLIKELHKLKDENLCLDINFWLYKKFQENKSFIKTLELKDVFTVNQDLIVEAKVTCIPEKTIFTRSGYKKSLVTNEIKNLSQKKHNLWTEYLKSKLEEDKMKYRVVSNRLKALCSLTETEHFEKKSLLNIVPGLYST